MTDPQNDFLSEDGAAWGLVGDRVRENNTIAMEGIDLSVRRLQPVTAKRLA